MGRPAAGARAAERGRLRNTARKVPGMAFYHMSCFFKPSGPRTGLTFLRSSLEKPIFQNGALQCTVTCFDPQINLDASLSVRNTAVTC